MQEISLLRKSSTHNRSKQILFEAIPFLTAHLDNPKSGVLAYLQSCRDRGNDNHTLENKRVRLHAFFKQQLGFKLNVPAIRFKVSKPSMYAQDELNRLFAHANGRDFWLFKTLLQAGLRKQEAMYLEYENLLDTGIQVTGHGEWVPKDYEERIVRVPMALLESLRNLPRIGGSNLLFPTAKGKVCHHHLRTLKRLGKRAGVNPVDCWLHKFRANFATMLMRANVPLRDIMEQMGHSSLKSTMRYLALLGGQDLQEKIEAVWT